MSADFEELAYRQTPIGALSLRRRRIASLDVEVHEIKLGDEFLMSSLFTEGEIALANLGLAELDAADLDVAIGGLGLGYTAGAALDHAGVRSVLVIEAIAEVIAWHRGGLIPLGARLSADRRCQMLNGDFFALLNAQSLDPAAAGRKFHAVLVDIDHSPRSLLHPGHAMLYRPEGLRRVAAQLHPGGVFALWSNDAPDRAFLQALDLVFASSQARVVTFDNPLQNRDAANTVYIARSHA